MICSQVRPFASFTHWPSFIIIHIHGKSIKIRYGPDRQSKSKFPNPVSAKLCTVHTFFNSFPEHSLLGPPERTTWKTVCNRAPSPHLFQLKPWMNSERLQFRTGTVPWSLAPRLWTVRHWWRVQQFARLIATSCSNDGFPNAFFFWGGGACTGRGCTRKTIQRGSTCWLF